MFSLKRIVAPLTIFIAIFYAIGISQIFFTDSPPMNHNHYSYYAQTEIYFRTTTDTALTVTENASLAFDALISGKDTITNESCAFQINGVAERDGNTTRIIGSTGKFILGTENAAFDADIEVDDTDDTLRVLVTAASTNRTVWSAKVDYTEVYY